MRRGPRPVQGAVAHPGEDRRLHPSHRPQVHERAVPGQLGQGSFRHRRPQPEGLRHALRCHGRVGARVAQKQVVQRRAGRRRPFDSATGLSPLQRQSGPLIPGPVAEPRRPRPGPTAPARRPAPWRLGEPRPARQAPARPSARPCACPHVRRRRRRLARPPPAPARRRRAPRSQLGRAQRAQLTQKIDDPLGVGAHPPAGGQVLELVLHLSQDLVVEQLRDTAVAQQGVESLGVQGEQLGPALGVGQVLLVDQGARVPEQQRVGEGRRLTGDGLDDAHRPEARRSMRSVSAGRS